jgi:hypothetical protein
VQDRQKKYADVRGETSQVQYRGPSVPKGSLVEEHVTVRIEREVNSPLYRTLQNLVVSQASSLQSVLTPTVSQGL